MTPQEMRKRCDLPAGIMLKEFGLMSENDFDTVGQWQATMLVLRDAAEDPSNPLQATDLPDFKGEPDLFGLMFKGDEQIAALFDKAGVTPEIFAAASKITNPRGVETPLNSPDNTIKVPFVGPVIKQLFVDQPTYEATMTMQHAIRAADTALRMRNGETDPSLHGKKREFGFKNPDEDQRLQDTVALHERLSLQESTLEAGARQNIGLQDFMAINTAFRNAINMFEEAKQPELANYARQAWSNNNELFGVGPATSGNAPGTPDGPN